MTFEAGETTNQDVFWAEPSWSDERERSEAEPSPDLYPRIQPHLPDLKAFLARRVPFAEIEDVIQDVLLRVCRRTEGGPIEHPRSYLFQVANAAIVDRHRREVTRCASVHCELSDACHPLDELSPLRILLAREDVREAEETLEALPERTREILIAMRLEGWSLKSLAHRYEISTSAIEKHVTRAVKALARQRSESDSLRPLPAQGALRQQQCV